MDAQYMLQKTGIGYFEYTFFEIETFYLNTIEQAVSCCKFEVCLPYSRLLAEIPKIAVFQNLRWNSNKTSL